MKRAVVAGIAAGAVIVGAGGIAVNPKAPSLPDVEVPAIELSSAEGTEQTAVWLELFTQASSDNPDAFGANPLDSPAVTVGPGQIPLVVIDPQDAAQDFEGILDGVVGKTGSALDAVTSPGNGPDAVTYLIRGDANNGS